MKALLVLLLPERAAGEARLGHDQGVTRYWMVLKRAD
jgi:hypothetical protein